MEILRQYPLSSSPFRVATFTLLEIGNVYAWWYHAEETWQRRRTPYNMACAHIIWIPLSPIHLMLFFVSSIFFSVSFSSLVIEWSHRGPSKTHGYRGPAIWSPIVYLNLCMFLANKIDLLITELLVWHRGLQQGFQAFRKVSSNPRKIQGRWRRRPLSKC